MLMTSTPPSVTTPRRISFAVTVVVTFAALVSPAAVVGSVGTSACAGAGAGAGEEEGSCGAASASLSSAPQLGGGGIIFDITATIRAELPTWLSSHGLGAGHRTEVKSHKKGDKANSSELRFNAHTGTHIDAPRHFVPTDPTGVDEIPLHVINGPALLVEAYGVPALTAEVLASLKIPDSPEVSRLLFRTDNTRRGLMGQTKFAEDYVAFTDDGAEYMVKHRPGVRAIGVDYLSIAALPHLVEGHVKLLGAGVVPIEGLVMPEPEHELASGGGGGGGGGGGIFAGWWFLHCAPLKIGGSDGAPARAWLTPMTRP